MAHLNPHVAARQQTNDRYTDLAKARRNWQIAAGVFGLIAVGSVIDSHYLMHRPPVEVVIAEVDTQAGAILRTYESGKRETEVPSETLIGEALMEWMEKAKGISPDWQYQRDEYKALWQQVGGTAVETLTAYYKENPPQEVAEKYTRTVMPKSLQQMHDKSWQVIWEERTLDKATQKQVSLTTWRAFLMVERRPLTSKEEALKNPLGLYVTSLSWGQDTQRSKEATQ